MSESKIEWTDATWNPVRGFPGYEVSSHGAIRSWRGRTVRVLKPRLGCHGYLAVCLRREGETHQRLVHRLVAEAFLGDSENKWVNHRDGNKRRNSVENLEWCTPGENARHAYNTGLQPSRTGAGNGKAKLTDEDVLAIRRGRANGVPVKTLSELHGVAKSTISGVANGYGWKHV